MLRMKSMAGVRMPCRVFLLVFLRNLVAIAGIRASDTNSDAIKVADIVIGIVFINSPIIPPTSSIGKNAKVVVAVPAIRGHLKVSRDSMAASRRVSPLLIPS